MHPDAEKWNGRYAAHTHNQPHHPPRTLLRTHVHLLPATGVVLDAAAGAGANSLFLAARGLHVIALDISEVGLRQARAAAQARGVRVETAVFDLTAPVFPPHCVDVILNFRFLMRSTFAAYRQALRPGGLLIFETFVADGPDVPQYFLRRGELRAAFADFEVVHWAETAVRGDRTGKPRPVAQLVARKPLFGERVGNG